MKYSEFLDDLSMIARNELSSMISKKIEPSIERVEKTLREDFHNVLEKEIDKSIQPIFKDFILNKIKSEVKNDNYLLF